MSRRLYAAHRWITAAVGIQLLLWSLGGLIFSTHSISRVRGQRGMRNAPPASIPFDRVKLTPIEAQARAGCEATHVELRMLGSHPIYELRCGNGPRLVDAELGNVRSPIDQATALALALADRAGPPPVRSIELLTTSPPIEYRELPLPAWRITFDDGEGTRLYIDAADGAIRARRNDAWRRYDFFWMLHTMDYRGRDDFNHPLLICVAALGVVGVLSGWLLWAVRLRRRLRRRRAT